MEVLGAKIAFLVIVVFWILPDFSASSMDACSCYSFHGNSSSRRNGRQHCQREDDGDLVCIETTEELNFIQKQLQNETTENGDSEWWIGLESKNGEWKKLGNHTEPPIEENLMNMLPIENEEKTFATIVYHSSNASLSFNAVANDTIAGWICEYQKNNCRNVKGGIVCLVRDPSATTTTATTINSYTTTNKPSTTAWITTTTKIPTTTVTNSTVAANTVTSTTKTTAPSSKKSTTTTTSKIVTAEPKTAKMTSKVARLTSLAPTTATTTAATTQKPFFIGFLTTTSPVHECLSDPYLVVAITVSVVGGVTVLFFTGLFLFVACRKNCSKPRQSVEKIEMEEGEYENHL